MWNQLERPVLFGFYTAIYQPVVDRLARRRVLQHADAEGLCQQVFLSVAKAVESWETQQEGPRFRNWIGRVARNAILHAMARANPDSGDMTTALKNFVGHFRVSDAVWAIRGMAG